MKKELIRAAQEALLKSYSPYSKYRVGAALLAGGKIFTGTNVENASYGLSICAERSAATAAVSAGERDFQALAIAVEDGSATPCGACRQFLREFGQDYPVLLVSGDKTVVESSIRELLPLSFGPEYLHKESDK